jgi:hypothetical protein
LSGLTLTIFGGSLGIAVKAPNIWWSIQSLGKTTDLTDQKRIFTD